MQTEIVKNKSTDKVIALVDMDCFYVQVEQRLCPEFIGKPCVVVQYNAWLGGGIIAVNYEARASGVQRRGMRGGEAKQKCPDLHLFRVPEVRGKANLTRYREAGAEVIEVLCQFSDCVERASVDEAYLDLTEEVNKRLQIHQTPEAISQLLLNTFVVGWDTNQNLDENVEEPRKDREAGLLDWLKSSCSVNECDQRLSVAAVIVEEMRAAVYEKTGFRCSAGIAHNKMLAKLCCGFNKPNRQTILPKQSVPALFQTLSVNKVRGLGGKLGDEVKELLNIESMGQLATFKESHLQKLFGEKNGTYLFQLGQGFENDPVTSRQLTKSIGCGKNFRGREALNEKTKVKYWIKELAEELAERLIKDQLGNNRMAKLMCISLRRRGENGISRSCPIHQYDSQRIASDALVILEKLNTASSESNIWEPALEHLSFSATKFQDQINHSSMAHIGSFFTTKSSPNKILTHTSTSNANDSENELCLHTGNTSVENTSSNNGETTSAEQTGLKSGFFAQKLKHSSEKLDRNTKMTSLKSPKVANKKPIQNNISSSKNPKLNSNAFDKNMEQFFSKKEKTNAVTELNISENPDHQIKDSAEILPSESNLEDCKSNALKKSPSATEEIVTTDASTSNITLDEFTYKCEHCKCVISLQDIEEHTDYHLAQQLQKELRSESVSAPTQNRFKPTPVKRQKRKGRPKKPGNEKKQKPDMYPIDYYLTQ